VRSQYAAFETGQLASSAEVYLHEMPGGQYANLFQQAHSLGLGDRWPEVGRMYAKVNELFGDIVKVTPTSKVVGDMTLCMLSNNLTPEQVLDPKREIAFPESVVEFFEGKLGQPPGGFPAALQNRVLRGKTPLADRPGALLPPVDFQKSKADLEAKLHRSVSENELISYLLYPKVFVEFAQAEAKYSDLSVLPTPTFFYGMQRGEEVNVEIEPGKTLVIKFLTVGEPQPDGRRVVYFELNGQPREVLAFDKSLGASVATRKKAEPGNAKHIAAPMPGSVVVVSVAVGDEVAAGQKLFTLEAMKMETTIYCERPGKVTEVLVRAGSQVEGGDLAVRFE
jgi:pyruvate carboxylase